MILNNKNLSIELNKLVDTSGKIDPKKVVKVASNENHPLHDYFEWNDTEAGREYRLWQARQLITRVYVIVGEEKEIKTQIFYNIIEDDGTQSYSSYDKVLSNEDMRKKLIASALSEIEYWQDKYSTIIELTKIIDGKELGKLKESVK